MKSVKMFGKKIPILAILIIVMISGVGVYAAVVNYLSDTIVTDTVVESPIDIKGTIEYWSGENGYFTTSNDGVGEWSDDRSSAGGKYSAKLYVPPHDPAEYAAGTYDSARLVFSYGDTLDSVTAFSYDSFVIGESGFLHPYVVLDVDTDDDDVADAWVVQWEISTIPPEGEFEWVPVAFGLDSMVHVAGNRPGLTVEHYSPNSAQICELDTINNLKSVAFDGKTWGELKVLAVKVMIGVQPVTEGYTAYVDNFVFGTITSSFEPEIVDFDGEPTYIDIKGGSEFYIDFNVRNLANKEIWTMVGLVMESPSTWTPEGSEIEEIDPVPLEAGLTIDNLNLVSVFDELGTIMPNEVREMTVRVQFTPIAEEGTYTINAVAVWGDIIDAMEPFDPAYVVNALVLPPPAP